MDIIKDETLHFLSMKGGFQLLQPLWLILT